MPESFRESVSFCGLQAHQRPIPEAYPLVREEKELPRLDSNQQPFD